MTKKVEIYTGPIIGGILLILASGMTIADDLNTGRDIFAALGILYGFFMIHKSFVTRYEA